MTVIIIVFRPDPVQGPGSRFWPGRPDQFFYLKKSKRRRFSKKKSTGCNQVFDRVNPPSHTRFFFPLFFLQPGLVSTPGKPGPGSTYRAGPDFKIMIITLKWAAAMKASTMWINIPSQVDVFGMLEHYSYKSIFFPMWYSWVLCFCVWECDSSYVLKCFLF
jgi:hypothetical protein